MHSICTQYEDFLISLQYKVKSFAHKTYLDFLHGGLVNYRLHFKGALGKTHHPRLLKLDDLGILRP